MFLKLSSATLFPFLLICLQVHSQTCNTLGQNPSTAFPVCGTATFSQSTVPYCGGTKLRGPCSNDDITDTNPFWYKFTCYMAGTLGFLITPNDLNDDYDWEIFDITAHDANDIYTNTSLFIACNWSGNKGPTGASSAGRSLQNCGGNAYPTFSAMPVLKQNHNYLLLLSHYTKYTPSQNGYQLSFGGGTASITDTLLPNMMHIASSCDAARIMVKLNKKMKCSSLAPGGSDFDISPAVSAVTAAEGVGCNTSFDMDSILLTLSNPLPAGNYTLNIKYGIDGNTLLDNCDRNIAAGDNLSLSVLPVEPVPMDSLTTPTCAPQSLQLVFKKDIRCNSIAADGSDFIVTGPTPVTVLSAGGNCINGLSNSINVVLSAALVSHGNYQVKLLKGSDGNTLIAGCGQQTPESTLQFTIADTVSAAFSYAILPGCKTDTISFFHNGANGVNQWLWKLDTEGASALQHPVAYFHTFGPKQIILSVSNGTCGDTVAQTIAPGNELTADFETNNLLCPEDAATFVNKSTGGITSYHWDFGNGNISMLRTPPPLYYPILGVERSYAISLIIKNQSGCYDTATTVVKVLKSCYIALPSAFTPNGDGLNDYLYPINAYKADSLEFSIYNRVGQLVFKSHDRLQKWNGKIKGYPQGAGIYVWKLKYTHHDTGKKIFQKGTTLLIR